MEKKGRNNLIDADCKIKCPLSINYDPLHKKGSLLPINYGPICINFGPLRINYGPLRINYGPLCKNHEMQHFAYKNTYNEAIFDL